MSPVSIRYQEQSAILLDVQFIFYSHLHRMIHTWVPTSNITLLRCDHVPLWFQFFVSHKMVSLDHLVNIKCDYKLEQVLIASWVLANSQCGDLASHTHELQRPCAKILVSSTKKNSVVLSISLLHNPVTALLGKLNLGSSGPILLPTSYGCRQCASAYNTLPFFHYGHGYD